MSDKLLAIMEGSDPQLSKLGVTLKSLVQSLQTVLLYGKIGDARLGVVTSDLEAMEHAKKTVEEFLATLNSTVGRYKLALYHVIMSELLSWVTSLLTRNLYERVADVSFLSKDPTIASFLQRPKDTEVVASYLNRYRKYYSVYDAVSVIDTKWNVLFSTMESFQNTKLWSTHDFKMIRRNHEQESQFFFELPGTSYEDLYYVHAVRDSIWNHIGYVMLHFDLRKEFEWLCLALWIDKSELEVLLFKPLWHWLNGEIILSSARAVAKWTTHQIKIENNFMTMLEWGNTYLDMVVPTGSFMEYSWLGWVAMARMNLKEYQLPVNNHRVAIEDKTLSELQQRAFEVDHVFQQLSLNGRLSLTAAASQRPGDISDISALWPIFDSTQHISTSIWNFATQSLSDLNILREQQLFEQLSQLSRRWMEMADRSFYERANDVRWWALNNLFIDSLDQKNLEWLDALLNDLNSMYTVYDNIWIQDDSWRIVAMSKPGFDEIDVDRIQADFNSSSAGYRVSKFTMIGEQWGYMYMSDILWWEDGAKKLGTLVTLFDCHGQLKSMLDEIVPESLSWAIALYHQTNGQIISTTSNAFDIGQVEFDLLSNDIWPGQQRTRTLKVNGQNYLIVTTRWSGYREFKQTDWYDNTLCCSLLFPQP